jgi:hypothetical protein
MAEIPSAAYIVIGLVVTIVSFVMGLTFFIYVGIIMVVWGLGKLSYRKLKAPKPAQIEKQSPVIQPHRAYQGAHQSAHQTAGHHARYTADVRCPHCGSAVASNHNFCGSCGARRIRA